MPTIASVKINSKIKKLKKKYKKIENLKKMKNKLLHTLIKVKKGEFLVMEKNTMISVEFNHETIPDSSDFTNLINDNYYNKYLDGLYKRTYNNLGRLELNKFQLSCSKIINDLFGKGMFEDYKKLDFISFFKDLESDINLESKDEIIELSLVLKMSSFLLEKAKNENNESLLHEAIYQVKSKLRNSKIIKKNQKSVFDNVTPVTKQDRNNLHISINKDETKELVSDYPVKYTDKGTAYE
jgi:hypothetical protein